MGLWQGSERRYYLTDSHFSVVATTDSYGQVKERSEYDDYGNARPFLVGDLNGDGLVDDGDFVSFYAAYDVLECSATTPIPMPFGDRGGACPADLNEDGIVDDTDFNLFVASYNKLLPDDDSGPRYAGYWYDANISFFNCRQRWYDPQAGRWLTRDPAGYVDGMSLYLFVKGNPFSLRDPTGLWVMRWLYTGDYNASNAVYEAALNAGGNTIPSPVVATANAVDTPTGRRAMGIAQAAVGAVGTVGGILTAPTVVGAAAATVSFDMAQAGVRQAWTGEWTPSNVAIVVDASFQSAGVNAEDSQVLTGAVTATIQTAAVAKGMSGLAPPAEGPPIPVAESETGGSVAPVDPIPADPLAKYSHIPDPPGAGIGKNPTPAQRAAMKQANRNANGGILVSDGDGLPLTAGKKGARGVTPDPREATIDHIDPKSKTGTNQTNNLRIISREENRAKGDK